MAENSESIINPELLKSRAQLQEIKKDLDEILKEDQTDYWARMCEFITGKLTRPQLDFFTQSLLTGDSVSLHNEFVKLALKCALLPTEAPKYKAPPIPEPTKNAGKKRGWESQEDNIFREQIKKYIKTHGKKEVSRLKALPQRSIKTELNYNIPMTLPPLTGDAAAFYGRGIQLPLCSESKLLPNLEMMRVKSNTIALENGLLEGADPKVAEVILQGLETHLESLLTNCLFKIRLKQTRSALSGSSGALLTKQNTITTRDLLTTFTVSPYLLAERPNALERLVTIHNPAFPPEAAQSNQIPQRRVSHIFSQRRF